MDSRKQKIVIALMVAMFLAAFEGTVVATAIPTIVKDLNGFELVSWIFSLYLLTSAVSTPIYGKLSDLYGRKNMLCFGIGVFLLGSLACGLSQNMFQLIVSRAVQGLGAGAIFTVTFTIIGDIFTVGERTKVQGWLSTVWGIASLAGPFLGGFLIDNFSWHWIFFINIPFGIISITIIQNNLAENIEKKKHKIDYAGTVVLSGAIVVLLYGILSGEGNLLSVVIASMLLSLFYAIEKRAEEPIVPFEIFSKEMNIVNGMSFLVSMMIIAITVYMPIYMQNILGFNATISGLAMAPMSFAWLSISFFLAKVLPKYGERAVIGFFTVILLLGCILLSTLGTGSYLVQILIYAAVLGFGFGGIYNTLTIMVQESVGYDKRGTAIAFNSLIRTLAQTIGVSIFGSILNTSIGTSSLNSGLHTVFILLVVIGVVCTGISFVLPDGLKEEAEINKGKLDCNS
jgi:EmrB/QacA subfamily drug resistance transporter